ncbi:hypothetical protein ACTJJ4_11675 [Microbacterium sp. 22195]|uniref:hypothetical protein n=1 Tax=Microbacterium sp. 22195 TaxID=3453891 RepID=UPI003F831CE3
MTDYTPTTEEVREQYWAASGDRRRGSSAWGEFDRWLAAHDAQKRAEWEAEQGERRPCRLPHTAPPCTTCRCGARVTWDAARERTERLAEQAEVWLPVDENGESK